MKGSWSIAIAISRQFFKKLSQKEKEKRVLAGDNCKIKGGDTRSFLYPTQLREEQGRIMPGTQSLKRLEEMECWVQMKNFDRSSDNPYILRGRKVNSVGTDAGKLVAGRSTSVELLLFHNEI